MPAQGQARLQQRRIGHQGQDRAAVTDRVKDIGIGGITIAGMGKPALQHGRRRREKEKRQPHRKAQNTQQPVRRLPICRRGEIGCNSDGQRGKRDGQQQHMQNRLPFRPQPAAPQMGIKITRQQGRLKEHHGDVPHRRRTAKQGQHHLGEHGLHHEQQQGAQAQGDRVQCQHEEAPIESLISH